MREASGDERWDTCDSTRHDGPPTRGRRRMVIPRLLVCAMIAVVLTGAPASAADDTARIAVTYLSCPPGYAVAQFEAVCDRPMAGRTVEVRSVEGPEGDHVVGARVVASSASDGTGRAAFELAPGRYAFSAFPGHTVEASRTICVDRRAPGVMLDAIPELVAGADLDCRVLTSFTDFGGGARPAEGASLTVRVRYCIAGVARAHFAGLCGGHGAARASVVVWRSPGERELAGRTDAEGDVAFAPDERGPWAVEVATNHELVDRLVVCERADYPGAPMASAFVEDGVAIGCDVYLVPAAYRLTTVGAEERATIEIRYRRCPTAYAGADHAADCAEPIGNAALGILSDGAAAGTGYTDLDGVVRFEVGAGEIAVDLAPLGEPDDRIYVICAGVDAQTRALAYTVEAAAGDRVGCRVYLVPA